MVFFLFLLLFIPSGCSYSGIEHGKPSVSAADCKYIQIKGFSQETNQRLQNFLEATVDYPERKVAVFDCDGTIFGQVPHYLADESLYEFANQNRMRQPEIIRNMTTNSMDRKEYLIDRIKYFAGMKASTVENLGADCFKSHYSDKFYPEMQKLIDNLKNYGFEVWIITASPEVLYEKFVSKVTGVPETRIIGTKSVIKYGIVTKEIVEPVPQNEGKAFTIDTFIKTKPLFAAGNSRGDFEMMQTGTMLKLVVNPNDTRKEKIFDGMTLKEYAQKNDWVIVTCQDVAEPGFPNVCKRQTNPSGVGLRTQSIV